MQRSLLIAGLLVLGLAWLGPLPELARTAFFAHMTMHMAVVAIGAPLIALGISGRRFDPVRHAPRLFSPIPASLVELIVVWAWHSPVLHHAARNHQLGLLLEQGSFLITGLILWLSALGGGDVLSAGRRGAGIAGLLLTSMHMTLLGALLALAPRPLYVHSQGYGSMTPLQDLHLGGAIMLLVGGVSYLLGGLWLTFGLLRQTAFEVKEAS